MKTWKQKQFDEFGFFGTRDDCTRKDMLLLVLMVWGQIKDNPNIYPTVRLLAFEKLHTINRYHQEYVIWLNDPITKGMDVGTTTEHH